MRPEIGQSEDLSYGIWFQSVMTDLWYRNHKSAGDVKSIKLNGVLFHRQNACIDVKHEKTRSEDLDDESLSENELIKKIHHYQGLLADKIHNR